MKSFIGRRLSPSSPWSLAAAVVRRRRWPPRTMRLRWRRSSPTRWRRSSACRCSSTTTRGSAGRGWRQVGAQHPAGGADLDQRRVEPDLAHDPAGGFAARPLPRRRQPVGDQRHRAERLLLAKGADRRVAGSGASGRSSSCPPAATTLLTTDKWGAGPTAVVLKQAGPWTYGALGNHLWSFAGDDARADVSTTFIQPFVTFGTPTGWSYTLQTESTYDWQGEQWSVPVNAAVSKVTKIGGQLVSLAGALRYSGRWAGERPRRPRLSRCGDAAVPEGEGGAPSRRACGPAGARPS